MQNSMFMLLIQYLRFCNVFTDNSDLREFDYERYLMEEIELHRIVDNPAMSMVRTPPAYCFCRKIKMIQSLLLKISDHSEDNVYDAAIVA